MGNVFAVFYFFPSFFSFFLNRDTKITWKTAYTLRITSSRHAADTYRVIRVDVSRDILYRTNFGHVCYVYVCIYVSICVCERAGCFGQVDDGQQGPWCGPCTPKLDGKFSDLFCESRVSPASNGATAPVHSSTHPIPCHLPLAYLPISWKPKPSARPSLRSTWKSAKIPLAECQSSDSGLSANWCKTNRRIVGSRCDATRRIVSPFCCYFFVTCRFDRRLVTLPAESPLLVICLCSGTFPAIYLSLVFFLLPLFLSHPLSFSSFACHALFHFLFFVFFFVRHTKYRAFFYTTSLRPLTFITLPSTYHNSSRPTRKKYQGSIRHRSPNDRPTKGHVRIFSSAGISSNRTALKLSLMLICR